MTVNTIDAGQVAVQIRALRSMRRETSWWRTGAVAIIAISAVTSVLTLRNSTQALVQPGPAQDEFTASLSAGLQRDVIPSIQTMAGQTLTEMRPQILAAFQKAGKRTPEIVNKSQEELATLQHDVASQSEQTLDATFTKELHDREPAIKAMFPNATDDKLQALVANMTTIGTDRLADANSLLFSKHMSDMTSIVTDMTKIQDAERIDVKGNKATWDIATTVLDEVEKNVQGVTPAVNAGENTALAAADAVKMNVSASDTKEAVR
jgi:hypothetical protein